MKTIVISALSTLLFMWLPAYATVWYVHPDSTLNSIQAALDSCAEDDIVMVGPGTYIENIIWPNTQGIQLMSELGSDTTIIDGNSTRVIDIASAVDSTTVIMGFTIRNGYASSGGGIRCSYSAPTISGNRIVANTAAEQGGGIHCYHCSPIIISNEIDSNSAVNGGGISCNISGAFINDNNIRYNTADDRGGGIRCLYTSATIIDNAIEHNHAYRGAGIHCREDASLIAENRIKYNTVDGHAGAGIRCQTASPTIRDNIISNNVSSSGGAGLSLAYSSVLLLTGNRIDSNRTITSSGGGMNIAHDCSVTVINNLIRWNSAVYGGGVECWDGSWVMLKHNVISHDTSTFTETGSGVDIYNNSSAVICSCTIDSNSGHGVFFEDGSDGEIYHTNIFGNTGCGVKSIVTSSTINALSNWWGDASGPFHPTSNPSGLGDSVSDYVDFNPWLTDLVQWVGVEEHPVEISAETRAPIMATIFSGPLLLPEGKNCRVFDITGRIVAPEVIRPGIYFIEVEGKITQKVVKVR